MTKALLLAGDTTYLAQTLPHLAPHLRGQDMDVYALAIDVRAVKRGDFPGLFTATYDVERLDPAAVMARLTAIPNLVYADVAPVTVSDDHVPWMHQYDLLKTLYARVPKKYTHYIRARFDIVLCEPLRSSDSVIIPTRYHHDVELLKKVVSDQFAVLPAVYADAYFSFADFYNAFKPTIMAALQDGSYNSRMELIPEYKLCEHLRHGAVPFDPQTIKAYPYSWLVRLKGDPDNAYRRDLPPEVVL